MSTDIIMPEQRRQVVTPISSDNSIMAVISRAAADPSCDIEKMERLLAMHERMQAKTAEQAFNAAMAEMQCEIPTVFEAAVNLHTGNAYATLDDITRTLKPIMQRHGFAITFKVENAEKAIKVTGILMHRDGHREETTMTLPADIGKGRNEVQAVGSSTTYGKRYVMCALLNITTGESRDDDGQSSDGSDTDDMRAQVVADILERVAQTATPEELKDVWQASLKVLQASGDTNGYSTVKTAVTVHKAKLEAPQ
ncbi:ERF family protein [Pseudomonas mediterranea]|uniref:ERF superfamily protein n=1 Tax=Pseudomonas mediterranea TaxID=183795 RepID=A0AAX2DEG0_9PSED|nr:ERF family protein [Pseudomonas mediterranea]KGU87238.1 ERF family protein [Pseudomonas mediterranea CFBP 5447]SDU62044.1 ERF superfamily protein [Pseudomonas mediterranea]